jgi:hypothetical protein
LVLEFDFLSSLLLFAFLVIFLSFYIFLYQVASTLSILAPFSHGIMRHEPLWVTYDNQPKRRDNQRWERWSVLHMDWDMEMLPYQGPPIVQLLSRVTTLD